MHTLNLLRGSPESLFTQLPVYLHNLKKHNPDTITEVALDPAGRFDMVFIALACSVKFIQIYIYCIINISLISSPVFLNCHL